MVWLGYLLIGLLVLLLLLICIQIKVELRVSKDEQWLEVRYFILKFRINLNEILNEKVNAKSIKDKSQTQRSSNEYTDVRFGKEESKTESKNVAQTQRKKKGSKAPKGRRWSKALKPINLYYFKTYFQRFKLILKEVKIVLYRLLSRLKIYQLESILYFNVDDPFLNAQLIAVFWTLEANFCRFLHQRFRKVHHHEFNVKSNFSGSDLFLELSCIVSFRIVDIIVVVMSSLKELLTIKRMVTLEKEV